jgi:hypothetical protein
MQSNGFSGDSRVPSRHFKRQRDQPRPLPRTKKQQVDDGAVKRRSRTRVLLIVPPFAKTSSGPPLGPAMLLGAARAAGHMGEVMDLAIEEVRTRVPRNELLRSSGLAGDHDKNEPALRSAQHGFFAEVAQSSGLAEHLLRACVLSWSEVDCAVTAMARSTWGRSLVLRLTRARCPDIVGISVMFSEQVLAALVITRAVRRHWPKARVVWGGAHVTALAPEIAHDVRYSRGVDGFIAGYAEQTFVELLDAVRTNSPWPAEVFRAGSGRWARAEGDMRVLPSFDELKFYGAPRLSLPAQLTRGCAYGKCGFCTYPHVEGRFVEPESLAQLEPTILKAQSLGAVISFKDALMTAPNLRRVAHAIGGRARWSACTKLGPALVEMLPRLASAGCETLEVGLETIVESSQMVILKEVSTQLVESVLRAAQRAGVRIVVNYMTGLPGESPRDAARGLRWIQALAAETGAKVEHHKFELERRAPLARELTATRTWPWASTVEWSDVSALSEAA